MAETAQPTLATTAERTLGRAPRSLWRDAWARLRRNRFAITGGVVALLLVLLALLAPVVAPYNPIDQCISIFAGFKNATGDFADACIDDAALADHNWISGGKHGNVSLWVPLQSCAP